MPLSITRPAPVDLTKTNPTSTNYITTDSTKVIPLDNNPDGSIRIVVTAGEDIAHIEQKASGVWNDTGFRFGSSSISIGRDVTLSAAAGFLETLSVSKAAGHDRALIPHIEFNDAGTVSGHMPGLGPAKLFDVISGPATQFITNTVIGQAFAEVPARVLIRSQHLGGLFVNADPITVEYFTGTDNTGTLFFRIVLPANHYFPLGPFIIDYGNDFGFDTAQPIFQQFSSVSTFSLAANAAGDLITAHFGHQLDEVDILLDNQTISRELDLTFDREINFVVGRSF